MNRDTEPTQQEGIFYQITICGTLGSERSGWFDGLEIAYQNGVTVLSGKLVDPQALFGVIEKIRDLGLELVEVRQGEDD